MSKESEKFPACSISFDSYALQRLERLENQTRRLNDELKIEIEFSSRIEKEHADLTKQLEKMIEKEMNKERSWRKNIELAVKVDEIAKIEKASENALHVAQNNQTEKKKVKRKTKDKIKK
uniref:Uncharacterized protein n=1 Tax=Panagrolaimus superbus TaxID=310955 RepID=A0A914Z3G9_9BILA